MPEIAVCHDVSHDEWLVLSREFRQARLPALLRWRPAAGRLTVLGRDERARTTATAVLGWLCKYRLNHKAKP